ncbi:MAG: tetratricopeptide repeat protein, partial [Gemmatimonadota bacterium]|nr:tetratricopeptide repeat protein [Gemmatimonadota bacterium]
MRGRHFFPAAFVACAFLTAAPVLAESGSADASFDLGMRLYESGDADGAATAFAECLRAGAEHSSVHYNLGNARFKQGDLGRAIFHY